MGNLLSSAVLAPTAPTPPSLDGEVLSHATFSPPAPSSPDAPPRYPLAVTSEISLQLSVKDLFFIARGSTSAGEVYIKEEEEQETGGEKKSAGGAVAEARVVVEVRFRDVDDLEFMTVVKLRKAGGGEGVGIYTPTRPFIPRPPLVFITTIYLPSTASSSLLASLALSVLTSNTPVTVSLPSTALASLTVTTSNYPVTTTTPLLVHSSISYKTSNAEIHTAGPLSSTSIQVVTSNKAVRADRTWKADRIKVVTSNARVDVLEGLELPAQGGKLEIVSSNEPINIKVASFRSPPSTLSASTSGVSSSKLETSNAPINVTFDCSAPLNSVVQTSNGPAVVVHCGEGFKGSRFEGKTSGPEGVKVDGEMGVLKKGNVDGRVWGEIGGDVGAGGGKTGVVSSNGGVVLRFD